MGVEFFVLLLLMLLAMGAWWSMVVFPKQRDFAQRQKFVQELHVGDEIITYGGLIAKVIRIDDNGTLIAEIADGVQVRLLAAAVVQPYDAAEIARNARMGQDLVNETAKQTDKTKS
jgi:preprotein translocase subunit YajC